MRNGRRRDSRPPGGFAASDAIIDTSSISPGSIDGKSEAKDDFNEAQSATKKLVKRGIKITNFLRQTDLISAVKVYVISKLFNMRNVRVKIGNHSVVIRPSTADLHIAVSTLSGEFSPLATIFPKDYSGLIVDAGGYIGTAAIKFAEMYPKATVVTIEPSTENFALLRTNVSNKPSISAINSALVANKIAKVKLRNRRNRDGFTIVLSDTADDFDPYSEYVDTITLAEILEKFGFDEIGILKLDIEGAEKELFETSSDELGHARAIFVELHDRIAEGATHAFYQFSINRDVTTFGGEKLLSMRRN